MAIRIIVLILLIMLLVTGCNLIDNMNSVSVLYETEQDLKGEWLKEKSPQDGKYKIITAENKKKVLQDWQKNENKAYYQQLKKMNLKGKAAILAYLGEMPTGGYRIQINKVIKKDDKLLVKVKQISPASGDMVTMAFTYPYDLVLLKKDKLEIQKLSNINLVVVNQNGKMLNK